MRRKQEAQFAGSGRRQHPQPVDEGHRRSQRGDDIAPALLASPDQHLLPVRNAFVGALGVETHHAPLAVKGLHAGDAELDRLLQCEIHALAARDRLRENAGERRFAVDRVAGGKLDRDGVLVNAIDDGSEFDAVAEDNDLIAHRSAQHVHQVMRCGGRQRNDGAGSKCCPYMNTRKTAVGAPHAVDYAIASRPHRRRREY